jgi:hypothetical protein
MVFIEVLWFAVSFLLSYTLILSIRVSTFAFVVPFTSPYAYLMNDIQPLKIQSGIAIAACNKAKNGNV